MPTSELSDALNPHVVQSRPRLSYSGHLPGLPLISPVQQQPIPYVPHRSELEYAISEPPPPPPPPDPAPVVSKPRPEGAQVAQELLRALHSQKEVHEVERERRIAWEQELDAKYAQRQAEMETTVAEMKHEIAFLRACIATLQTPPSSQPSSSQHAGTPPPSGPPSISSVATLRAESSEPATPAALAQVAAESNGVVVASTRTPVLIAPSVASPALSFREPSRSQSAAPSSSSRKRPSPMLNGSGDCDDDDDESDASRSSGARRPSKRRNHHDKKCYTIQVAMRRHIYRLMGTGPKDDLPSNHLEGLHLSDDEPVRFVWAKTARQSPHNARMKSRIVKDLIARRQMYKHVPDEAFQKKALEAAFDQAFTTLRLKAKGQSDESIAQAQKAKEDHKAMKARRFSRKKLKLGCRTDARQKMDAFSHPTFDGALHLECMSSEESSDETSKAGSSTTPKDKKLVVRGIPWRSTRLIRFYGVLDEDDKLDKSLRPKRGSGRKERTEGPPKVGAFLPPTGVANWMISRRWLRDMQAVHPDTLELLKGVVVDPPGFDWNQFDALGYESEDEMDSVSTVLRSQRLVYPPIDTHPSVPASANPASSSLQYALAPLP